MLSKNSLLNNALRDLGVLDDQNLTSALQAFGIYVLLFDAEGRLMQDVSTIPLHSDDLPQNFSEYTLEPIKNSSLFKLRTIVDLEFATINQTILGYFPEASYALWASKTHSALINANPLDFGVILLDRLWDAISVNTCAATLLSKDIDELKGGGWRALFTPEEHEMLIEHLQTRHSNNISDSLVFNFKYITPLGRVRYFSLYANYINDMLYGSSSIQLSIVDNTDRHLLALELQHAATHDGMTQLLHHSEFMGQLNQLPITVLANSAVIFIDIDKFKHINDTYGHSAGDDIIRMTSQRLVRCFRQQDLIARFGGDEFVIHCHMKNPHIDAPKILGKIFQQLNQPFLIEDITLNVGFSIGLAFFDQLADTFNSMTIKQLCDITVENADKAMYYAKHESAEPWCIFDEHIAEKVQQEKFRLNEVSMLECKDNYHFVFQPILKNNKIISVEALLRVNELEHHANIDALFASLRKHSDREKYFNVMINNTLIEYKHLINNIKNETDIPKLNLNVEVEILHSKSSTHALIESIKKSAIPPASIYIEVTEEGISDNPKQLSWALTTLKQAGLKISLDDFGTGYSSLKRLMLGEFDQIKIDAYFIHTIIDNPKNIILLKTIALLASELKLEFIAEGVETAVELSILKDLNWDMYQGYFFYKPLPVQSLISIINCQKAE